MMQIIKTHAKRLDRARIIVVSALAEQDAPAGCRAFYRKPADADQLLTEIAGICCG